MKILFAGSENGESAKIMQELGARHLLLSYYYLRKKKNPKPMLESLRASAKFLFLDSGAHTFFHEAGISVVHGEKKEKTQETPDVYLREYIEWLKVWGGYFDGVAELDIDQIVGHDKILEWHELWKESKLPNVVYVYHPSQPKTYWEKICKENEYVGIQGNLPLARYTYYFGIAKKHKTKVHGFAMTKPEAMAKMPFFSVDSKSWQAGERFGMTYEFNGRTLLMHTKDVKERVRRRLKAKVIAAGIDFEKFAADDRHTVGRWNLLQWIEWEKFADSKSKKYWSEDAITGKKETSKEKANQIRGLQSSPNYRKIGELRKDPEFEARRLAALRLAMKGNIYGFKHGKHMKTNAFLTCANCYVSDKCQLYQEPTEDNPKPACAFSVVFNKTFKAENFDVRNMDTVMDSFNSVVRNLLERLARGSFFEEMDGGMLDKGLVPLYATLAEFLKVKEGAPPVEAHYTQNNYYATAEELRKLDPDQQAIIAEAIERAIKLGESRK